MPTQTATGTIAVRVEDTNDNCPRLTSDTQYLCSDTKVRHHCGLDGRQMGLTILSKMLILRFQMTKLFM